MKWEDFERGNIPEEFVSKFLSTIPREVFVKILKIDPRFQKEFAGFRPEHIPLEKIIRKFTPYFLKDKELRFVFLEEWVIQNKELIKFINKMTIPELKREIPRLIEKYNSARLSLALLFDGRAGIEKIADQIWKESFPIHEKGRDPLLEVKKELEEARRKIEDLEEQRDRLFMEVEAEKNRRATLEERFFSLKRENKSLLDRVRELEKENQDLKREIEFVKGQDNKFNEYKSQIHNLTKEMERIRHELEKERKGKETAEKELLFQKEENKKLRKELYLVKNQMELFQNIAFIPELKEDRNIQGAFITIVCSEGEMPGSFYKIASNLSFSLLVHTSKVHDEKLNSYLSGSEFVFILGEQVPESFREIVQSLCYSKGLPCFTLPFAREDLFEKSLKALCYMKRKK